MIFFAILCTLAVLFAATQIRFYVKRRKLLMASWGELLNAIQPVDMEGIAEIADCYLHPTRTQLRLEPDQIWAIVGGFEGLEALSQNADAMLNLAVYAAQWNRVEGRIVGEMIRRDGVRLKKAVRQIRFGLLTQSAAALVPFELQEAAATYHLMRGRLLGLYETAHVGLHAPLAQRL